jgi:NADH-quinone oxidoreductase subunit G
MFGNEIYRVTARKDKYGEVEDQEDGKPAWICNDCRFDKKEIAHWMVEGPRKINRHSVISQGQYTSPRGNSQKKIANGN